jgi:hypothetical protein
LTLRNYFSVGANKIALDVGGFNFKENVAHTFIDDLNLSTSQSFIRAFYRVTLDLLLYLELHQVWRVKSDELSPVLFYLVQFANMSVVDSDIPANTNP